MSIGRMKNRSQECLLRFKIENTLLTVNSTESRMNEEKEEMKIKPRIIEIDRKIAARLADVWMDMKQQVERFGKMESKKKKQSKLRNEVKED